VALGMCLVAAASGFMRPGVSAGKQAEG
jgi:hypothetical protein